MLIKEWFHVIFNMIIYGNTYKRVIGSPVAICGMRSGETWTLTNKPSVYPPTPATRFHIFNLCLNEAYSAKGMSNRYWIGLYLPQISLIRFSVSLSSSKTWVVGCTGSAEVVVKHRWYGLLNNELQRCIERDHIMVKSKKVDFCVRSKKVPRWEISWNFSWNSSAGGFFAARKTIFCAAHYLRVLKSHPGIAYLSTLWK